MIAANKVVLAEDAQGNYALKGYTVTHNAGANILTSANDNYEVDIKITAVKIAA